MMKNLLEISLNTRFIEKEDNAMIKKIKLFFDTINLLKRPNNIPEVVLKKLNTFDLESPLSACCSLSSKLINRDSFTQVNNEVLNIKGVVVADGIGDNYKVNEAANFVVEFVKAEIEKLQIIEDFILENIFKECKITFDKVFNDQISNDQFGTTLIGAFEYVHKKTKRIKIGYMGNGAVWHIKGNFNQFDETQLIPWNCINYLNPHSIQQNGQEALTNCISLESLDKYREASTIDLSTDSEFGDIIMICTDGIYSYDHMSFTKDSLGKIWMECGESMKLFYYFLGNYFKNGNYTDESLSLILADYLSKLKEENLLNDDATLGIIILPKVIEFQKKSFDEPGH